MKRFVPLVLTFTLAGLAIADTVRVTAEDAGNCRLRIGYEVTGGTEVPVAIGLDICLSGPAIFSGVVSASPYFPIYPGSLLIEGGGIIDYGTPVADAFYPGTLGGMGTSGVTIEMGVAGEPLEEFGPRDFNGDARVDLIDLVIFVGHWLETTESTFLEPDLDHDGVVDFLDYGIFVDGRYDFPPLVMGELLLLQLDGKGATTTTVTIFENVVRGGIVGEPGVVLEVMLPEPFTMVVPEPATVLLVGLGSLALTRKRRA
jgi:hypothetical protein